MGLTAIPGLLIWAALQKIYMERWPVLIAVIAGTALFIILLRNAKVGALAIVLWLIAVAPLGALLWWVARGAPLRLF